MPNLKSTGLLSVVETGTMHGFRSAMVSEETGVNSLPNFKLADLFFGCCCWNRNGARLQVSRLQINDRSGRFIIHVSTVGVEPTAGFKIVVVGPGLTQQSKK